MNTKHNRSEYGQSLVFFAIISFVFIGLLALALDVGYVYTIKRSTQNAADAGALAGASTLCGIGDETTRIAFATSEAYNFAGDGNSTLNKVPGQTTQVANVTVNSIAKQVTVKVDVTYNTLLGGIFGKPNATIQQTAAAGCKPGGVTEGALPIAKDCGAIIPDPNNPGSFTCSEIDLDPDDDTCKPGNAGSRPNPGDTYDTMYVFVNDSENISKETDPLNDPKNPSKTDQYVCSKEWTDPEQKMVNCDYDGDGQMDMEVVSTANPFKDKWMWVDLSPTTNCTNSSCLRQVVQGEKNFFLNAPIWIPGGSGAHTKVYDDIEDYREGDMVAVPVFNWTCKGTDPEDLTKCDPTGGWKAGDQKHLDGGGNATNYFRIVSWAWFRITDVCWKGGCYSQGQNPARESMFNDDYVLPDNSPGPKGGAGEPKGSLNSIEGCFVRMTTALVTGVSNSGVDTGVYSVYLIK